MSRRGWVLFAAMSVIWGLPYLLIKVAVGGVPVPVLVLARVAVGAALLLPFALRRRQFAAITPVWPWLLLFAVVEIILPWFALSEAERGISSSLTGLLIASTPVIVAVLSLFLAGGDRLSPVRWIGLLIGLGGVALLAGPRLVGSSGGGSAARSVAEVLFVALCYATGPLIANRKLADLPPVVMTAACLVLASVVYAPLAALNWPSAVPSASVLLAMAGLAVVCTAAAFLIFFKLIAEAGPARASVITYINPAIAVTLGVAVLGEHVTATMLIAFGTILVGSVLATRPARRSRAGGEAGPERSPEPVRAGR
ncbi:MAG TPA: DMT family transporter [Streptosporangiaceae bacterium]|nr:DMT family transporter [Streptosporangiaceae bacterium]